RGAGRVATPESRRIEARVKRGAAGTIGGHHTGEVLWLHKSLPSSEYGFNSRRPLDRWEWHSSPGRPIGGPSEGRGFAVLSPPHARSRPVERFGDDDSLHKPRRTSP